MRQFLTPKQPFHFYANTQIRYGVSRFHPLVRYVRAFRLERINLKLNYQENTISTRICERIQYVGNLTAGQDCLRDLKHLDRSGWEREGNSGRSWYFCGPSTLVGCECRRLAWSDGLQTSVAAYVSLFSCGFSPCGRRWKQRAETIGYRCAACGRRSGDCWKALTRGPRIARPNSRWRGYLRAKAKGK